ncbi:hypothetical protein PC116_g7242 [Phytophthora cactorum]|uniref:Uncharacterized protein n=1 Tax=Phytophthora cactorum TaxID=29920 RepID=A0A329SGJ8_9STRA|nr:hypothetical protein PC114_g5918 [Phytophthora cactorum]KAG4060514.1 hypothetical protein PC123_g4601 [Phytophthora cactorum]KAG4244966.1 hypothetical protein PC116_g7242 [Phytophthora cactorum]RAW35937.1 hypothetical protein PC110_g7790 [Phytophthora cactorum]
MCSDHDANHDLQISGGKPQELKASASEAPEPASKKKKSKSTRKKLKGPESDAEESRAGRIASAWDENALERAYYRKVVWELFNDPVMKLLQLRQIGNPTGPESMPPVTSDKLIAVTNRFQLLKEADLVAGAFDAIDLFDLDLDDI